jgi:hypothetical protein
MPPHSSHLLQPLDVSCFSVLKRSYGRLVEQKMSLGVNHIDKHEFIPLYQQARTEVLNECNIKSGFSATGLVPYDPERVLSVLHAPLKTPSPQLLPQGAYTTATPHNITELEYQVELVKQQRKRRRTQSSLSSSDQAFNQLVKGCQMAMHGATLLKRQNEQLLEENKRQKQNRVRKCRYIAKGGIYIRQEAQELIDHVENSQNAAEIGRSEESRPRAPLRCSLCTSLEHKANRCPERQGLI